MRKLIRIGITMALCRVQAVNRVEVSMPNNQLKFPSSPLKSKFFSDNGNPDVIKWDVLSVHNNERMSIVFESVSSPFRQGIFLMSDGGIEIEGKVYPQVTLWADTAPKHVVFTCHAKDGRLHLYNVWDEGRGRESQAWKSGMQIEAIDDGFRYRCTDAGPEVDFNTLLFRLVRSENPQN